jgi:anthranilate synthase component 2
MLLGVLDNRDSFTFNLVHLLEPHFGEVRVRRCDDPSALTDLHDVDALVLSPGPGLPRESGALMDIIADHFGRTPILGVCLGMQALAEFTGGRLVHTGTPRHGIARPTTWTEAWVDGTTLPNPMLVGLYHSWAVDSESLGPEWSVTATDFEGLPAAIRHCTVPVWAVQFHPESVLTPQGGMLLSIWATQFLKKICYT